MPLSDQHLTPTMDLFMEVLAGRYRAGESTWTFEARHRRTANALEDRGLVWWKSGVVEDTILAGLTTAGRTAVLSPTYRSPLARAWTEGRNAFQVPNPYEVGE